MRMIIAALASAVPAGGRLEEPDRDKRRPGCDVRPRRLLPQSAKQICTESSPIHQMGLPCEAHAANLLERREMTLMPAKALASSQKAAGTGTAVSVSDPSAW
jgi:hypothetical protein